MKKRAYGNPLDFMHAALGYRVLMACLLGMQLLLTGCSSGGNDSSSAATEFDPNNRDRTAFWWAGLVKDLAEAKASENQIRVDAAIQKIDAARKPLVGRRIKFQFNVWTTNPGIPETVWNYKPISSAGVWVGILLRADQARIHVGMPYHNRRARGYIYAFQLKPGKHIDPAILGNLSTRSKFIISATISQTGLARLDTWHKGTKRFSTPPTLLLFIKDIKVEKIIP